MQLDSDQTVSGKPGAIQKTKLSLVDLSTDA